MLFKSNKMLKFLSVLCIFSFFSCNRKENQESIKIYTLEKKNGIENVINYSMLNGDLEYLTLEKLYSINTFGETYEIPMVSDIDVDDKNNLYILCYNTCEINVFNDKGEYLKTFGGRGYGPGELLNPRLFSYYNNNFYIYEDKRDIIVLDCNGRYVEKININFPNTFLIKRVEDNFFVMYISKISENRKINTYSLSLISNNNSNNVLLNIDKNWDIAHFFNPVRALAVDNNGYFYFPENSKEYSIKKYDINGTVVFSFERIYDPVPYSQEAQDCCNKIYEESIKSGSMKKLTKYPPTIRKLLIDSRNNIWVVSGEDKTLYDNMEIVVDIFNDTGKWIYNFKTPFIESKSLIKNDRLYTPTQINQDGEQYINVYKIHYNY